MTLSTLHVGDIVRYHGDEVRITHLLDHCAAAAVRFTKRPPDVAPPRIVRIEDLEPNR